MSRLLVRLAAAFGLLRGALRVWRLVRGKSGGNDWQSAATRLRELLQSDGQGERRELLAELLRRNEALEQAVQQLRRGLRWCTLLSGLALLAAAAALLALVGGS